MIHLDPIYFAVGTRALSWKLDIDVILFSISDCVLVPNFMLLS